MEFIPYNSRLSYHKSPFGAVKEGEEVAFRIVLPRSICCTGASLVVDSEDGSQIFPMTWDGMEGTSEEWWRVTFVPAKEGLYGYHFIVAEKNGVSLITRFEN